MERVACYIRVSHEEQKLYGISLDAQRDKLTDYCKTHNLKIAGWYEDAGVSGRKLIKNRPALQTMIQDAQAGLFDRIIFIKLDRFFRSISEYYTCMKMIEPVVWTATEEKYDLTTASGRAFTNMKLTISELEADQTGERIRLVNDYKVKTGQPVTGSLPWSHKIIKVDGAKKIIVDPDTRDQCLDVIRYYLRTQSLKKTLTYCDQYHKFYDLKGLKKWLTSTLLCGAYRDNNEYCEPLLDRQTYDLLQHKLENNIKYPRLGEPLFRKMLICPECGKHLTAVTHTSKVKDKKYRYEKYRCDNYRFKRCSYSKLLSENMIERLLLNELDHYLREYIIKCNSITGSQPVVDVKKYREQMDRVNYMFESGRMSLSEYDKKYNDLQHKIESASVPDAPDPEKTKQLEKIINSGWRDIYSNLTTENKANFWHSIIKDVEITKIGRVYEISHIIFY